MKKIRRFLYVGIISTLVDYAIYSLLLFLGSQYIIAIIIGYSTGFIISFIFTRNYVFDNIKIKNFKIEFIIVLGITIVGLLLNIGIVKVLHEEFALDLYLARIFAIGIVFFFNYFSRKGFIYG